MSLREGRGQMSSLCFIRRGQMSTILHLLRGQCPPLSITWGADVLIYHFSQGGRCPRGKCPAPNRTHFVKMVIIDSLDKRKDKRSIKRYAIPNN